ncbi:MAG: PilZ domain-containing protein [Myxococcota bacterium]
MGYLIREARQRRTLRRSVDLHCQAVAEDGFRLVGHRLLDVSPEGALVQSASDCDVGENVLLSFPAPGGFSWIDAEGEIVRVIRGRRYADRGRCFGIRFERVDPVSHAVLTGALHGLPPPVPGRGVRRDYAATVAAIQRWG